MDNKELEAIDNLIDEQNRNIDLGKDLQALLKNRAYKKLIEGIYIKDGKKFLWENIKTYEEAEMMESGSTREGSINLMKGEIKSRLSFERFIKNVEDDAEHAVDALEELSAEREKIITSIEGEK